MAAIDEARCRWCGMDMNAASVLRCDAEPEHRPPGTEHIMVLPLSAIEAALDGLNRQGILDDDTTAEVSRALLGPSGENGDTE